jgi:hypothetical protein
MVECLPNMCKAVGSILSTLKEIGKKKKAVWLWWFCILFLPGIIQCWAMQSLVKLSPNSSPYHLNLCMHSHTLFLLPEKILLFFSSKLLKENVLVLCDYPKPSLPLAESMV